MTAEYGMSVLRFDNADLIAGLCYEHTRIDNIHWTTPAPGAGGAVADGAFSKSRTEYNQFLPSVQLNVRPDAGTVYRLFAAVEWRRTEQRSERLGAGPQPGGPARRLPVQRLAFGRGTQHLFDSRSYRATVGRKDVGIGTVVDSGRTPSLKLSYGY